LLGTEPITLRGVTAVRPRRQAAGWRQLHCAGKRAISPGRAAGQSAGAEVVIDTLIFPGGYQDQAGYEAITWRVESSRRYKLSSLDFFTTVRGIDLWSVDFDSLEPVDPAAAAGKLPLGQAGELTDCMLSGDLPCTISAGGQRRPATIAFTLDLRPGTAVLPGSAHTLTVSMVLDGVTYEVADDWFEDGIQRLERALPPGVQLVCCVTCLFSDYSPGGHGMTGIRCHRGAKEQYLAVRSKADYWPVPVTEEVPETYLCEEYQRRIPGTGYRG
jgi:hypothetical protein